MEGTPASLVIRSRAMRLQPNGIGRLQSLRCDVHEALNEDVPCLLIGDASESLPFFRRCVRAQEITRSRVVEESAQGGWCSQHGCDGARMGPAHTLALAWSVCAADDDNAVAPSERNFEFPESSARGGL